MCIVCRSLFVPSSFFFWSLCYPSFDLRILITSLISSKSSIEYLQSCRSGPESAGERQLLSGLDSGQCGQGRIKDNLCPKHRPIVVPRTFHWHNVKSNKIPNVYLIFPTHFLDLGKSSPECGVKAIKTGKSKNICEG